ncbi:MAG: polysaccharide biosynthesis/export family protein [Desulfuromonadaceae bacterium]|nr:polysaccharide biosynthesis/export family protein [Desulfuromonadaceae bacterium]
MFRLQHITTAALIAGLLSLTACAPTYRDLAPGTVLTINQQAQTSAVVERQVDTIPPLAPEPAPPAAYLIGSGDLLSITVYGHPELGSGGGMAATSQAAGPAGAAAAARPSGSRVDETGCVRLPLIGSVQLSGLSAAKAEEKLRSAYKPIIKEPWISVEVQEYRSRPLYLFGNFKKPGIVYMDRPLTLLQGIALADGIDNSAALRSARLSRNGKVQPVDIYELLANGDQRQNVWLHPGDAIYLPDKATQQVFVFGSVKKGGPVPMNNGQLNLTQALAAADPNFVGGDPVRIRIIRSLSPTRGELLVVDYDKIMRGEAFGLPLAEGDVVFVPRTSLGNWNDAIAEILPSLTAVSAILQPFVSMKYLSQ